MLAPLALLLPAVAAAAAAGADDLAARTLAAMSLEEKAGQLVMAYPPGGEGPIDLGGVILLGKILRDPEAMRARVEELQRRSRVPLLVAVDLEGGDLNRLRSVPTLGALPPARELGAEGAWEAEAWGRRAGLDMVAHGLNTTPGWHHRAKDGRVFDVEIIGYPVPYAGRACELILVHDVTERREAEARLEELRAQLAISDRMAAIGTLAAGVAHEINNPLTWILANVTFAAEQLERFTAPSPADARVVREALDEAVAKAQELGVKVEPVAAKPAEPPTKKIPTLSLLLSDRAM